jgi:predicted MPP superfamily phosphohydrolase
MSFGSTAEHPADQAPTSVGERSQPSMQKEDITELLERRLGRVHAAQRLGIEKDHEATIGHAFDVFDPDNWYSAHTIIRLALKFTGLYGRGHANATRIQVRHNDVFPSGLPDVFDGFTLLHISDTHADLNLDPMDRLIDLVRDLEYDICVLTGDFRGQTFGPFDVSLASLAKVRNHLHGPVYAVLGNHDSIHMVPEIEAMDIRMLLNESETIFRGQDRIHLAGIDDAHYYRTDNIQKAAASIPHGEVSILLSHTPEIYRQAAHAGFDLTLSGHTHAGQICLPGSIPITLDSVLPRRMGGGSWRYGSMAGYTSAGLGTSIVPVRFNCPPEITLHHLRIAQA